MPTDQQKTGSYYTPQSLADAIIDLLGGELTGKKLDVLEPSVGGGAFVSSVVSRLERPFVTGCDINEAAPGLLLCGIPVVGDFLLKVFTFDFDLIVGNVPFSVTEQRVVGKRNPRTKDFKKEVGEAHVRKCLSLLAQGGVCAIIQRAAFLHPAKRADLLERLDSELKISPRPPFKEDGKGDNSDYSLFIWRNSKFPPRHHVGRLDWDKPSRRNKPKAEG